MSLAFASAAPSGTAYLESRVATHDGYIWPIERRAMRAASAIHERMVEDIGRMVDDGGEDAVVAQSDLVRLGWPQATVSAHATHAFLSFRASRRRPRRDRPARLVAELTALALFVSSLALCAGVVTGAI